MTSEEKAAALAAMTGNAASHDSHRSDRSATVPTALHCSVCLSPVAVGNLRIFLVLNLDSFARHFLFSGCSLDYFKVLSSHAPSILSFLLTATL